MRCALNAHVANVMCLPDFGSGGRRVFARAVDRGVLALHDALPIYLRRCDGANYQIDLAASLSSVVSRVADGQRKRYTACLRGMQWTKDPLPRRRASELEMRCVALSMHTWPTSCVFRISDPADGAFSRALWIEASLPYTTLFRSICAVATEQITKSTWRLHCRRSSLAWPMASARGTRRAFGACSGRKTRCRGGGQVSSRCDALRSQCTRGQRHVSSGFRIRRTARFRARCGSRRPCPTRRSSDLFAPLRRSKLPNRLGGFIVDGRLSRGRWPAQEVHGVPSGHAVDERPVAAAAGK